MPSEGTSGLTWSLVAGGAVGAKARDGPLEELLEGKTLDATNVLVVKGKAT